MASFLKNFLKKAKKKATSTPASQKVGNDRGEAGDNTTSGSSGTGSNTLFGYLKGRKRRGASDLRISGIGTGINRG